MEPQHLHAVLERRRNCVQNIGRRHEKDLREIVFNVQIVVREHVVLLWIEHFQQGRRRVAAEIHRHFVHFVQHKDRVLGPGFLHHLDDLTRQCANVGAAMATDFSFVADSAQRHADELAACRPGDRHSQRSLADSGRADEAQDRAFGILYQLTDSEKLKNALFDFLQPIVIFIQDLFGAGDVADFLGTLFPRHCQQPVQIIARNR